MKTRMVFLVLVLVLVLNPGGAGAVLDNTPDVLGVYFDTFADALDTTVGTSIPFYAYFILTNPSSSQILGFEFSYHMDVPVGMESSVFKLAHIYPPGIIDITLPVYDALGGEFLLSWGAPVPTTVATTLMTFQYMLLAPMTAHLTTGPISVETLPDGLPAYWDASNIYPLGAPACSGVINDVCSVAVEIDSFGAIKALYR